MRDANDKQICKCFFQGLSESWSQVNFCALYILTGVCKIFEGYSRMGKLRNWEPLAQKLTDF